MKQNIGSAKIMLIFILGLLFFTVIQPTYYSSSPPPDDESTPPPSEPTATPTPSGTGGNPAFFTISPPTSTIQKGQTLSLALTLNTGDHEIDTVDLVLNFDPQYFQTDPNLFDTGTIFPNYTVQTVVNNRIQISAAGEIQGSQVIGFQGEGEYAKIVFQALETVDSTQITFDGSSQAVSAGQNQLDLTQSLPGNYTITN